MISYQLYNTMILSPIPYLGTACLWGTITRHQRKKIFDRERKYYLCDHLLWYVYLGDTYQWYGKLYENIVYTTLLYYGYQVFVGKWDIWEVDFIAQQNNKQIYFQIAYLLADDAIIQREYQSLQSIADNRPKYVLSGDDVLLKPLDWIVHHHIWDLEDIIQRSL